MSSAVIKLLKNAKRLKDWKMVGDAIKELDKLEKGRNEIAKIAAPLKPIKEPVQLHDWREHLSDGIVKETVKSGTINTQSEKPAVLENPIVEQSEVDVSEPISLDEFDGFVTQIKKDKPKGRPKPINTWVDDGTESADNKENEKKLYIKKPVERRPEVKKIDATCDKCHRHFKIFPSQLLVSIGENESITRYYRCNKCT